MANSCNSKGVDFDYIKVHTTRGKSTTLRESRSYYAAKRSNNLKYRTEERRSLEQTHPNRCCDGIRRPGERDGLAASSNMIQTVYSDYALPAMNSQKWDNHFRPNRL